MNARKRMLMVDDDVPILEGLARVLRPMRAEWEFVLAQDGPTGLELLEAQPFDVVMSDMRMPGMNGVQFLSLVKARWPQAVRLVLSGHSEQELLLQCVGVAHQILSKPCDPEILKAVIHQTGSLGAQLENAAVKALVSRLGHLPAIPSLHQEISACLGSETATTEEVAALVSRDPGMTANILRLVNSAYFGLRRPVSSVREAIAYLGMETLRSILLATSLFDQVDAFKGAPFTVGQLWSHTLSVATTARRIAVLEKAPSAIQDDAFTGGLLHDAGILLLAGHFPEGYQEVQRLILQEGALLPTAEHSVFGVTHGDVGAYLMALWGLPRAVVNAIAWHHVPSFETAQTLTATLAVHAADILAGGHGTPEVFGTNRFDDLYVSSLGLQGRLETWRALGPG